MKGEAPESEQRAKMSTTQKNRSLLLTISKTSRETFQACTQLYHIIFASCADAGYAYIQIQLTFWQTSEFRLNLKELYLSEIPVFRTGPNIKNHEEFFFLKISLCNDLV
jgi:hypothetical protein